MTYCVIIEPPAEAELEEAYQWIARDAPQAAARWYNGLVEAIDSLKSLPERCPLAPENDAFDEDIRQLLYGKRRYKYRILFTIVGQRVHVLHIRHGARQYLEGKR